MPKESTKDSSQSRKPNRPFPSMLLEDAVKLAESIKDYNAGQPFDRLLLADAMGIKPSSSNFREVLKASYQYGLTNGSEKSETISLTELGEKLTKPTNQSERTQAIVLAALAPELAGRVYKHFNRNKWPAKEFLRNSLERQFSVSAEWSASVADGLEANARYAGLIRSISGSDMLMTEVPTQSTGVAVGEDSLPVQQTELKQPSPSQLEEEPVNSVVIEPSQPTSKATHIFLGHGKNKKPLEQLKNILNQFKISSRSVIESPSKKLIVGCQFQIRLPN